MLILVRHGRTPVNAAGCLQGRVDASLDELGSRQASALGAALAAELAGTDARVVCSPLARARETATAVGLPVDVDERWVELDYGEWDGQPLASVPPAAWARWRRDLDFAPPGGETLRVLGDRVRVACDELREEASERDIVVVSHVSPIKAAVAWALDAGDDVSWRLFLSPASITRIATVGPQPSLRSFNDTAHLTDLAP